MGKCDDIWIIIEFSCNRITFQSLLKKIKYLRITAIANTNVKFFCNNYFVYKK